MWDGWTKNISDSLSKTQDLQTADKTAEAQAEYRKGTLQSIKKIYSEAATVCPDRFSAMGTDWSNWTKQLYKDAVKAEKEMAGGGSEARSALQKLRDQFYILHEKTKTQASNDFIFAFNQEASKNNPDFAALKTLRDELDKAPPSVKAKAEADAYQKAKAQWAQAVDPILQKSDKSQLTALRSASDAFYQAWGIQVE